MRLIDADALKESIPETKPDIFENCGTCTTLMDYEVKDLINKQPTIHAPRWVRCEEPPKEYGKYIVCWKDGEKFWWEKADWDEDWCTNEANWYSYRDSRATIIKPDYWMPIEPPKEDTDGK